MSERVRREAVDDHIITTVFRVSLKIVLLVQSYDEQDFGVAS